MTSDKLTGCGDANLFVSVLFLTEVAQTWCWAPCVPSHHQPDGPEAAGLPASLFLPRGLFPGTVDLDTQLFL